MAANYGRKYFGSKFFCMKFFFSFFFFFFGGGGGQNGEQFLFKANFLERKFLGSSFGGEILVRRKFRLQKYFGGFL